MGEGYRKLLLALGINTVIMYFVMFTMIAELSHMRHNLNFIYMAVMMAAPMAIVMLIIMRGMFDNRKLNLVLFVTFGLLLLGSYAFMREQTAVGDTQFLRSMIPHHSGAILMCGEARITDPEIQQLCRDIVDSQRREIGQMEAILDRM